jgi:hypothetical protein
LAFTLHWDEARLAIRDGTDAHRRDGRINGGAEGYPHRFAQTRQGARDVQGGAVVVDGICPRRGYSHVQRVLPFRYEYESLLPQFGGEGNFQLKADLFSDFQGGVDFNINKIDFF